MRKILVITATLGARPTLKRTIDSVRIIGGDFVKHVIVCPKERKAEIEGKYDGITCLAEEENKKGIYAALNHGFYTYGHDYEYLTFINDDDYWLPDYKYLIEAIQSNLDFVYGKVLYILENKEGKNVSMACGNFLRDFIPLLYKNIVLFTQQATIIRSSLFFEQGGFYEGYKLVSDSKFWAEISLKNIKYKYINKVCAAYTIQDGQLSSSKDIQKREHADMLNKLPVPIKYDIYRAYFMFRICNISVYIKRLFRI